MIWHSTFKICLLLALSAISGSAADSWTFATVRDFGYIERAAVTPTGPLLRASDGVFYGVADRMLYRLEADGSGFRVLRFSQPSAAEDQLLVGTLWEGPDGRLYGASQNTTRRTSGVLTFQRDGSGLQLLHRFAETNAEWTVGEQLHVSADGSVFGQAWKIGLQRRDIVFRLGDGGLQVLRELPTGIFQLELEPTQRGLAADSQGALHGVCPNGGAADSGVVFRIQPDGSGYSVLYEFGSTDMDMGRPAGPLRLATDGNLYGLSRSEFSSTNLGAIYRVTPAGQVSVVRVLVRAADQPLPEGGLMEGSDGRLYGTSREDGFGLFSKIYRFNKDGSGFEVIYSSVAVSVGIASLAEGADGRFYTTSPRGPTDVPTGNGSIFRINGDGTGFTNLHLFHSLGADGGRPFGPLIVGSDGALYGTTAAGGADNGGTVFRINRDGSAPRILRSFFSANDTNGYFLLPGLIEGQDGALYGAASYGGAHDRGTLFRIGKDGSNFVVLHHFAPTGDGANPMAGLTQGPDGTLFGTTREGGTNGSRGTVFCLNTNGSGYRVLHDFLPATQGVNPMAPLLFSQDGELYGVTLQGGPENGGTVFALQTDGTGFRVLHSFTTNAGAAFRPGFSVLVESAEGLLYGVVGGGVVSGPPGPATIYRIRRDGGDFTVVHRLSGGDSGYVPPSGLTRAPDGGLMGAIQAPGPVGTNTASGFLYRLDANGSNFTVLTSFQSGFMYFLPGGLVVGPDAALYGADQTGGELLAGKVFRLMPPDYQPRFVAGTARRLASGEFVAQLVGTTGQNAVVESSPDLQDWNPVLSVRFISGGIPFTNTSTGPVQFYRIRVP